MTRLGVLCPLSGEQPAERILPSAVDAAAMLSASLCLFSAVEDAHLVARQHAYLADILDAAMPDDAADRPVDAWTQVVVDPHAPQALARIAASAPWFTAMATSTSPLLHRGYAGSAATRVIRDAYHPVLVDGPRSKVRLSEVERVVVCCDGSKLAEVALPSAASWAKRLSVPLWLVTVQTSRHRSSDQDPIDTPAYLANLARVHNAQWTILEDSNPARAISRWAGRSLVALTTHGRGGLSRLKLGSVATGVTRWTDGLVLISNGRPIRHLATPAALSRSLDVRA